MDAALLTGTISRGAKRKRRPGGPTLKNLTPSGYISYCLMLSMLVQWTAVSPLTFFLRELHHLLTLTFPGEWEPHQLFLFGSFVFV